MHHFTQRYLDRCLALGVLTKESLRKYPLRSSSLALVLKAYANAARRPYTIDNQRYDLLDEYQMYLTDAGIEWLFDAFQQHSLNFLRSVYQHVFVKATEEDLKDLYHYEGCQNFLGVTGDKPKAGTKQRALIVRSYGKNNKIKKEFEFDTLREARVELMNLLRFYPLEQFELYRIRKLTKKGKVTYYKEKVPIIVGESKRGHTGNLPNTRGVT